MARDSECFVYVVGFDKDKPPAKVGIASDPFRRVANLQTAHHQKLVLVGSWATPNRDIARYIERAFHEVLASDRLSGEWFDLPPRACMAYLLMAMGTALDAHTDFSRDEINDVLARSRNEYV